MLILGVDTAGKQGSIALVRESGGRVNTLEVQPIAGGTFSAQLVPQLARMLSSQGLDKHSIDGFAVVSGPGSFTGLRIGLTAVKALAEILQKPIAAVSLLEALALAAADEGRVTVLVDAGRNEVFVGVYEVRRKQALKRDEVLLTQDELLARLRSSEQEVLVTADGAVDKWLKQNSIAVRLMERPASDFIARLGLVKIRRGETVSVEGLDANYIRRSDAEIFSLPKLR